MTLRRTRLSASPPRLARDRGQVSEADVEAIQRAGYSDAEIVEIIANVAINVFANIINKAAPKPTSTFRE